MQEQVYTTAFDGERYVVVDLRGETVAIGKTFAAVADSVRNRQRSGWLAPGVVQPPLPLVQP